MAAATSNAAIEAELELLLASLGVDASEAEQQGGEEEDTNRVVRVVRRRRRREQQVVGACVVYCMCI